MSKIRLSEQEQQWILEGRVTRLTDGKEVQIYPMGAERYLAGVLLNAPYQVYDIKADIIDKNLLVIPGFGNSSFLFAQSGAQSVTVIDKDPVTIAWIKAFKKYYHYREGSYPSIGDLLTALTRWYPPFISLPHHILNAFLWIINPNSLRRVYIHYMLKLSQQALQLESQDDFELDKNIRFYVGELYELSQTKKLASFDTAFIPYLLGVRNGIESEKDIVEFMQQLFKLVPKGSILVNPSRNTKEYYLSGKRYFETTAYDTIQAIPELQAYFKLEIKNWFRTQGLAVFSAVMNC